MKNIRKFSVFISSTYEDLKNERQALMEVALENNFIPVGMEQFHAAPTSQWNVITKMIDECDFYLLVIGGRYGSIDEEVGISYTEKEYNYAKNKLFATNGPVPHRKAAHYRWRLTKQSVKPVHLQCSGRTCYSRSQ